MKNSAWYHRLWLKKLSELPVKEDSSAAWGSMKEMLDVQLPVVNNVAASGNGAGAGVKGITAVKSVVAKLVSTAVYVIPVAAVIGVTTYFIMPAVVKPDLKKIKKEYHSHIRIDTLGVNSIKISRDSVQDTVLSAVSNANLLKGSDASGFGHSVNKGAENGKVVKGTKRPGNIFSSGRPAIGSLHSNRSVDTNKPENKNRSGNTTNKFEVVQNGGKSFSGIVSSQTSALYYKLQNQLIVSNNSIKELSAENDALILKDQAFKKLMTAMRVSIDHSRKNTLSKNSKYKLSKNSKEKKAKKTNEITTPQYNFGLEAGLNTGKSSSPYFGILASYQLKNQLLLNAGIRINTSSTIAGNYTTTTNYAFGDSTSRYKVSDSRKIMVLAIPLTLEYKISNRISVNAGAVISFPVRQSNKKFQSELLVNLKDSMNVTAYLDSVRHRAVDSTLNYTKVNKINIGLTGGISYRMNQFYFEAKYLQNITPYKVNNVLGGYKQYYRSFQLGIRYQFKK